MEFKFKKDAVLKKVLLGMSGGVDSSVCALLLQNKGFEVVGITLNVTKNKKFKEINKVLEKFNIEHYFLDISKDFKNKVIDYFIEDYKKGKTPNPCIVCNKEIKFKILLDKMKEYGCDFIATGHFAKIAEKNGKFFIKKGKDEKKEQSYFLFELDNKILSKVIFPLGNLYKKEVKDIATKNGLDFYKNISESQDICFIENDYKDFLKNYIKSKKGIIKTLDGKILGEHEGLFNYTIGQKKGLGLNYHESLSVLKLDTNKNELVVGKDEDLKSKKLILDDFIVHDEKYLNGKESLNIKIRYRSKFLKGKILKKDNKLEILFNEYALGLTPGQGVVFYYNDIIVGGGWI
jgi:tRNA-uridine 2-sulfurtransferase